MKFLNRLILILFIGAMSCTSLPDVNIDPDVSPTAKPQQILTSVIGYTSWIVDGRYNELSYLWAQYWTWGPGVSLGNAGRYVAEPDDHNNVWARCYSNALTDASILVKGDDPAFRGAGKVLTAYIYQGLVDHFGDVPYSEAIKGEEDIQAPKYDDAATIYASLIASLDDAVADLESAPAGSIGAEDLIFGGDLDNWISFAKSLKLRLLMRQSVTGDAGAIGAQVNALINEGGLISDRSQIVTIEFLGSSGDENPMFATREAGIGNFYVASNASLNLLSQLSDPRMEALYDPAPNFMPSIIGIDQGAITLEPFTAVRGDYSQGSAITYGAANSVILMSDWEVWFLRAEAAARYNTSDNGSAAFSTAVTAHFDYLGVAGADEYLSTLNFGTNLEDQIESIAIQKWISMNGLQEDEGWIESRRFDTPTNPIFSQGIFQTPTTSSLPDNVFPSAWLYPQTELSLNANAPAQRTITDKLFWDN